MKKLFVSLLTAALVVFGGVSQAEHARGGFIPSASACAFVGPNTLPTQSQGGTYNYPISATMMNCTAPITFTLASGALPGGMSLTSGGTLTATNITTTGTYNFTVLATDAAGATPSKAFTLFISPSALTITTTSPLPSATMNSAYSDTLTASGGTPPYTWSFSVAPNPAGSALTVNSSGIITGTPTAAGTYNMTAKVVDSVAASATLPLSITVNSPPAGKAGGLNVQGPAYFTGGQPFLNYMKAASNSSAANLQGRTAWFTSSGGESTTNQEGYLASVLNADGYPTAFSSGGQTWAKVYTILKESIPLGPNNVPYPGGTLRVQATGNCDITLADDVSVHLASPGDGSKHSITTPTFTPSTNGHLILYINSLGGGSSGQQYCTDISVVNSNYASSYDSGAIFDPTFLASLSGVSAIRFMDWRNQANNQFYITNGASAGATQLTMSRGNWGWSAGTYTAYFVGTGNSNPQSEVRTVSVAPGSNIMTWTGALTYSHNNVYTDISATWANRSKPSNAFWDLNDGVPFEICIALANQVGADAWTNVPITATDSYITSYNQLIQTGSTSGTTTYAGLNPANKSREELSNEIWNSFAAIFPVSAALGYLQWPTAGNNQNEYALQYYGMREAVKSELDYAAWGGSSQLVSTLGAQFANQYTATDAMACPYWTGTIDGYVGPCSAHKITAIAVAPYWGGNFNQNDLNHMTTNGTAAPLLNDFFCLATSTSGTCNGYTYTSNVNYLGNMESSQMPSYKSTVTSNYPGVALVSYEGGSNFGIGGAPNQTEQNSIMTAAALDSRWLPLYTGFFNAWGSGVGSTDTNVYIQYDDTSGNFGLYFNTYQTLLPKTSAPYAWQAFQTYIGN